MGEMNDLLNNAQSLSRIIIERMLTSGARVIDATVGNGQDTLYLAERVGSRGFVWGFDIQEAAIECAHKLIPAHLKERVQLIRDSHENMGARIREEVALVLFNLGYLPRGDRAVTTTAASTLKACSEALALLAPEGIVLCVVYRGHVEGRLEWRELVSFGSGLDQNAYNFFTLDFPNQANDPPGLIAFQKR
jgi:SAM-dependent methyltransferase